MQTIQRPSRFDQLAKQIAYSRSAVDIARASMSAKVEYEKMKEAQKMAKAQEYLSSGMDEEKAFKNAGFSGTALKDILASRKLQRMKEKEEMAGLKEIERAREQGLTLEELREQERVAIRRRRGLDDTYFRSRLG